jgi:hypothetical protein
MLFLIILIYTPIFLFWDCIMDRQIPAERAWNTPVIVSKECVGIEFPNFLSLTYDTLTDTRLHNPPGNIVYLKKASTTYISGFYETTRY